MTTATEAGYQLEGSLLEVCSCDVLCPCWIGEDPDQGTCDSVVAYHFDRGTIRGVDVGGLTLVSVVNIPGNVLEGNWRQLVLIDDNATDEQADAMLDAFSGKLGGPLADLAQLVGERVAVERAPISHEIVDGAGTLKVGDKIVTTSGIYGQISKINEQSVLLQVADKVRIEIARASVGGYQNQEPVVTESGNA